jgi:hypothetical protein
MITIFRTLLVTSIVIFVGTYWLPYFDTGLFPDGMNDMRTYDGLFAILPMTPGLEILIFILGAAIPIAMYFFVAGSRLAFVTLTVVLLVAHLGFGVRVLTPIDVFLGDLIALLDGAILAIAYFTSVASRFERAPQQNQAAPSP